MNPWTSDLFDAFREDHAILGRGLHEISGHLRGGDICVAKAWAERVDREAGAHIAFEERFFYPVLRRLLGDAGVDHLYGEHGQGLMVIKALADLPEGTTLSDLERQKLLENSELMESHIAECGELFGAIGRIPQEEQNELYRRLLELRAKAPRWTELAAMAEEKDRGV